MGKTKKVFEIDPDLKIREELLGFHSMNPFVAQLSSARSYMYSSHLSQSLTIEYGEEKIIQTGLETQFANNTFSKKVDSDVRVIKVIPRYRGIDSNSINITTELLLIVENLETGEIDYIDAPQYFSLHQYFGFKYKWNKELLDQLTPNTILTKDTVIADSPTVGKNNSYKYGINANVALMTLPETAEDGVVISKSLSEKLSYKVFETRVVEFGSETFPLNIYGDENTYKAFPEIGELINEDSVIMVLRDYDSRLSPALTSIKDVREYNPIFDKCVYVKGPGEEKILNGYKVNTGVVVDIKAFHSPKFKRDIYTDTANDVEKYVKGLKIYYQDIIDIYEDLVKDHYRRYKNNDLKISEKLHRLIVDALAIVNSENNKLNYSSRNEQLDIYRIEFTIEYTVSASVGSKVTDSFGSKGIVVEIKEDSKMPMDLHGNRADVVMDPSSVTSRMNAGRLYEQYINAMSRKTKIEIIKSMGGLKDINEYNDSDIEKGWSVLLGLLEIIGTEQFDTYKKVSSKKTKREIIEECLIEEVYILYKVSSDKTPYQIVLDSQGTIYAPEIGKVMYESYGEIKTSKDNILIAPIYTIILAKTADNYLSSSSAKTNHYGLPIGVGNSGKNRLPWRNSPVKVLSETESRLYVSYVSRLALAELKDRGNSVPTHEHVYMNILDSDTPTNIDRLVDRGTIPYGEDAALGLIENIFNSGGIAIDYVTDKNTIHSKK